MKTKGHSPTPPLRRVKDNNFDRVGSAVVLREVTCVGGSPFLSGPVGVWNGDLRPVFVTQWSESLSRKCK